MVTDDVGFETELNRRQYLLAAGTAATFGLAGCNEVTSQEFEATPVRLPEADRRRLQLAETAFDSDTVTREPGAGGVEGEVTITSHAATYQRGPAHGTPTVMEAFLSGVNGTLGAGAAVVATGDALGIDDLTLPVFEEDATVPGSEWSLVVPEGARTAGEVSLAETILLVPGTAFPGSKLVPGDQWFPGSRWVPGDQWVPDDPESLQVLMATHEEESEAVFDLIGQNYEDLPGRPLEDGEAFETENAVLAVPGSQWIPGDQLSDYGTPPVFDAGAPAPLRGGTFGLGVLATPNAELAGQSANPVAGMGSEELLTSDPGRRMLRAADVTDADDVEWLRGPQALSEWGTLFTTTLLDGDIESETYAGIVSGEEGPWGVVVSLGRHVEDDIVIAASTQASPVGSTTVPSSNWLGEPSGDTDAISTWLTGGGELSAASYAGLQRTPDAGTSQNNYAEITFTDQQSDGTAVTVDRTYLEQDGFLTIHTMDLITQQNGPGTIIGVSRLLEAGENGEGKEYLDEAVELFSPGTGLSAAFEEQERLRESQTLVAVPHRDLDQSGDFQFTVEPHVDVPFTEGTRTRSDLPIDGAVNDVATVNL